MKHTLTEKHQATVTQTELVLLLRTTGLPIPTEGGRFEVESYEGGILVYWETEREMPIVTPEREEAAR